MDVLFLRMGGQRYDRLAFRPSGISTQYRLSIERLYHLNFISAFWALPSFRAYTHMRKFTTYMIARQYSGTFVVPALVQKVPI